jgi:hypothetical protein
MIGFRFKDVFRLPAPPVANIRDIAYKVQHYKPDPDALPFGDLGAVVRPLANSVFVDKANVASGCVGGFPYGRRYSGA